MSGLRRGILLLLLGLGMAACNLSRSDLRPSPVATMPAATPAQTAAPPSASPAPSPSPAPLLSPSPRPPVAVASPSATASPSPVTPAATPTATSVYFEYAVNDGETLFYILQLPRHGYGYEPNLAATVVALNANIPDADSLRGGITILIPRPTAEPTALGIEATQEFLAAIGAEDTSGVVLPAGASIGCHIVEAGDAIIGVAVQNNTTLEILHGLNRDLNWFGCNFTLPSGGENCAPQLTIGQCVRVPLPTPLPTRFPTPTGQETATPTATKLAPRLLYPADGARVQGPLLLQWLGIAGMNEDDVYLIELVDQSNNRPLSQVRRANAFQVPAAFAPAPGQEQLVQWRVSVARADAQGVFYFVGAQGLWRTFTWLGG